MQTAVGHRAVGTTRMVLACETLGPELVVSKGRRIERMVTGDDHGLAVSDGELIERAGTGDRFALETLYERYARSVFGLALRRLGDRGRAEDAVQETFVSVWRAAKTFSSERDPGAPWLYAVARDAIVDRARARNEPAVEVADEPSSESGPDERAEQSWTQWRVHCALGELPASEREVIALAYWSGLSQSEVRVPLGFLSGR